MGGRVADGRSCWYNRGRRRRIDVLPEANENESAYRFGVFELDPAARELRKRGVRLKLQGQPFEVLASLLESPGQIVSRDDLKARLWPQDTFVEFDRGLNTAVQKIRQALDDSADTPRYLETVPRQGYRFIFPVERVGWRPASAKPSTAKRSWVAAAAAAVVVAGLAYWLWSGSEDANSARAPRVLTINPLGLRDAGLLVGMNRPVISPDGRFIVYQGLGSLWLYDLRTGGDRPLEGTEGNSLSWCSWSPDSRWIAYAETFQLFKCGVDGDPPEKLADIDDGAFLGSAWASDGEAIVFSVGGVLFQAPSHGGSPTPLLGADGAPLHGQYPHFLPSGALLFVAESNAGRSLFAVRQEGESPTEVLAELASWSYFSKPGFLLLAQGPRHMAVSFDEEALEVRGPSFRVADRWEGSGHFASASDDGVLVFEDYSWGVNQLVWRDRAGGRLEAVGKPMPGLTRPLVSPDRQRILATAREAPGAAAPANLWVFDVENPIAARLTSEGGTDPAWTADSQGVMYRGPDGRLRQASVNGDSAGGEHGPLPAEGYAHDSTPDGRYLVGTGWRPGAEGYIWLLDLGSEASANAPAMIVDNRFDTTAPALSPDGKYLAYQSDETGRPEIYVQRFPGGGDKTRVSTDGGTQPRWRGDGRELYYVQGHDLLTAAEISLDEQIRLGARQELFRGPNLNTRGHNYDVSPDGTRFLVVDTVTPGRAGIRIVENWDLLYP